MAQLVLGGVEENFPEPLIGAVAHLLVFGGGRVVEFGLGDVGEELAVLGVGEAVVLVGFEAVDDAEGNEQAEEDDEEGQKGAAEGFEEADFEVFPDDICGSICCVHCS